MKNIKCYDKIECIVQRQYEYRTMKRNGFYWPCRKKILRKSQNREHSFMRDERKEKNYSTHKYNFKTMVVYLQIANIAFHSHSLYINLFIILFFYTLIHHTKTFLIIRVCVCACVCVREREWVCMCKRVWVCIFLCLIMRFPYKRIKYNIIAHFIFFALETKQIPFCSLSQFFIYFRISQGAVDNTYTRRLHTYESLEVAVQQQHISTNKHMLRICTKLTITMEIYRR